ncbi:MAG: neutral/alkaline non-lysosomal ceramidase N-terminal domain-containing protein [Rhodopirellula sp.]|nr:neutral/alkaline non-lysosomal ceramidase N-terminal domain-containing protein [Rhodopirellula sp.]
MRRQVVMTLMILGVAACGNLATAADMQHPLKAGAATADITPETWPVELIGSFSKRLAGHAWDQLNARALVLDNGETRLAFVTVDSCLVPRTLFDEAKRRAAEVCGISADHILTAATHTHSAPRVKNGRNLEAPPEYVEQMTRGIVSALQQATFNLTPSELGWGTCQVPEEVHNRRWFMKDGGIVPNPFGETTDIVRMNPPRGRGLLDRPAGPTDPEVVFLSVRSHEGRPLALLANYSLHYVGGVPAGGVSSDYFGEFATQLHAKLFPDGPRDTLPPFVGILSNGTSGDVNNINFTNPQPGAKPFVRIREVAARVVDRIVEALPDVKYRKSVPLAMAQQELTLKVRKPTPDQVARAKQFLAEPDEKNLPIRAKAYADRTLGLHEHPGTEAIILQAVRVGDVGVTSIPCEVFTEIGLRLKEQSPLKPSFTMELANGHYGYLPTPRQHELGGYETWMGTNNLEIEASDKIEAVLLELMRQVAK